MLRPIGFIVGLIGLLLAISGGIALLGAVGAFIEFVLGGALVAGGYALATHDTKSITGRKDRFLP